MSLRFLSSNQFKYHKRGSISKYNAKTTSIRCALLNTGDVYAERSTLAPQLALIFRRRIAYNAGYCRSLYFQRMLRRELRTEREKTASMCTLRYVQHPRHCACTCVRCSFNLGIGCAGSGETDESSKREKNLSRPRCGRFHNPHNALFVARAMCCERKRGNCYTHTHFRRRVSKKTLHSLFSIYSFIRVALAVSRTLERSQRENIIK